MTRSAIELGLVDRVDKERKLVWDLSDRQQRHLLAQRFQRGGSLTLVTRVHPAERLTADHGVSWFSAKNEADSGIDVLFFPVAPSAESNLD